MYGFKGTDKDMKCRGFQYTLNQEYIHKGELKICESGFHLCEKLEDVFKYYSLLNCNRYFIVKHGEKYIKERDKIVSDTITFLEEITPDFILNNINEDISKYDLSKNFNALLRWADVNGYLEVVRYLYSKGADIIVNDNYNVSYIDSNGHLEIVKNFIAQKADIKADNNFVLRWLEKKSFNSYPYRISPSCKSW